MSAQDRKPRTKARAATDTNAQQYAPCRVLGHEWHHVGRADNGDRAPSQAHGSIGYVSTCSHCGMRRVRWFTRSGMIAATPSYTPPEGYARRGEEVLTLQEWRRTWLTGLGVND